MYNYYKGDFIMKKQSLLKVILSGVVGLFGALAFFLSFGAKLNISYNGETGSYNGIIWGCKSLTEGGKTYQISEMGIPGVDKFQPAVLPLIGLFLILLGVIAAVLVGLLVKKPWAKWVVVACAVVVLTGAVFQFFAYGSFVRAYVDTIAKAEGITATDEMYKEAKAQIDVYNPKAIMSTLCGVFGIIAGLAAGVVPFLPEKK